MSGAINDFEAAKTISDLLKEMDGDRQQRILRWVAESLNLRPSVAAAATAAPAVAASDASGGRSGDIRAFVDAKMPKSDNQFAAVVAYFYRFEAPPAQRSDTINAEVLQNAARLAGRARLNRPLKTLSNAKNMGYLDPAERGHFKINSVGENLVAMALPGGERLSRSPGKAKRRSKKKPV